MDQSAPTQQYIVFRLGNEEYAFDIVSVKEIKGLDEIAKVHRTQSYIEGVMNLRGKLVTIIDLRKRLGLKAKAPDEATKIVIIEAPDAPVGFLVDEVSEVLRLAASDVEPPPSYVKDSLEAEYVRGIAKLGDRLVTVVDPVKILELSPNETPEGGM